MTLDYQWRKGGVDIAGATSSTLNLGTAGNGNKGDAISVRVRANDGFTYSAPVTSSAVTILNSAPVVDSVVIDQATPGPTDTLTATIVTHDDDGDTRTLTRQWIKNGTDIGGQTGATLNLGARRRQRRPDHAAREGERRHGRLGARHLGPCDGHGHEHGSGRGLGHDRPALAAHQRHAVRDGDGPRRPAGPADLHLPVAQERQPAFGRDELHARPQRFGQRRPGRQHLGDRRGERRRAQLRSRHRRHRSRSSTRPRRRPSRWTTTRRRRTPFLQRTPRRPTPTPATRSP